MKLTINESPLDRIIRIVAGLGLAGLAIAGIVTAPIAYAVWVVAAVLLVTGIVGFCPLYALLGVSTKRAGHGRRGGDRRPHPGATRRAGRPTGLTSAID